MVISTPLLIKTCSDPIEMPELAHLSTEEQVAILDAVFHSAEYEAYQEAHATSLPFLSAIILATIPLLLVPIAREVGIGSLYWLVGELAVLAAALIGVAVGIFSKYLRSVTLSIVVTWNFVGLLRCIVLKDFVGVLEALVAAVVVYVLVLNLGAWLVLHSGTRELRSLVRQHLARSGPPALSENWPMYQGGGAIFSQRPVFPCKVLGRLGFLPVLGQSSTPPKC